MLLAIPVHSSTPQIERLATDLKKRAGSLRDHVVRIISDRQDEPLAYMLADELADHCRKITTETLLPLATPRNQILLANHTFLAAIRFLDSYQYGPDEVKDAPLLYLSPDYRPASANWVNELQAEYFLKNSPTVMGRTLTKGGKKDKDYQRVTVGPVIFGRNFSAQAPLLHFLDAKQHWRVRMQHEIAQGLVETKQIGIGQNSLLKPMPAVKV